MSYYRVKLDGVDIYDPAYREMTLINPVCTTSLGETGNFEFTFPKGHVFADSIIPYGSNIEGYANQKRLLVQTFMGFLGGPSGKESACDAGHIDTIPGLGRSWKRAWQPAPVFLPGESHRQRSLEGYSP